MSAFTRALLLVLPLLTGCFVAYDDPPPQAAPAYSGGVEATVSYDEEVDYVVYREYFGCSDEEIAYFPHYRRYYGLSDDDIYFIYFTSRQCDVSFDVCFHSYYYDCDRNYDRLVVYYRVPRERYFVAIGPGVSPPPMYARPYASYRGGRTASVSFSNQEYVALVHLKVGVEYQGRPPETFFARVQATGSPRRVIVESRDESGRGGRTASGGRVTVTAPRPWTLPPQQKEQWHHEREANVVRKETQFKDVHREQVQKTEKRPTAPPPGAQRRDEQRPPHEAPGPGPRRPDADRRPAENPPSKTVPPREEPRPPHDAPGPGPKHPDADRRPVENPPPKPPRQDPPDRPREGEKPRNDDRGDRKDKDR